MIKNFKELKRNLKKDTSSLPVVKVALLVDTVPRFLSPALKGLELRLVIILIYMRPTIIKLSNRFLILLANCISLMPSIQLFSSLRIN